jgi:hypothetical protein
MWLCLKIYVGLLYAIDFRLWVVRYSVGKKGGVALHDEDGEAAKEVTQCLSLLLAGVFQL